VTSDRDEQQPDDAERAEREDDGTGGQPPTAQPPEQTKDDTDVGWGEVKDPEAARDEHERWLLEQRPPHWG
jgi:hypothetical protein